MTNKGEIVCRVHFDYFCCWLLWEVFNKVVRITEMEIARDLNMEQARLSASFRTFFPSHSLFLIVKEIS